MTFPRVGLSGGRRKDMTWSGSSGLCRMLFETCPLGHLKFYICRLGGRVGEGWGGRAGGRAVDGLNGRTGRWVRGRVSGRDGGAILTNVLI